MISCLQEEQNAKTYWETLKKLLCSLKLLAKTCVWWSCFAAVCMCELLAWFKWEVLKHPPYSLNLAPSDFHFFVKLKEFLGSVCPESDDEVKTIFLECLTDWQHRSNRRMSNHLFNVMTNA